MSKDTYYVFTSEWDWETNDLAELLDCYRHLTTEDILELTIKKNGEEIDLVAQKFEEDKNVK